MKENIDVSVIQQLENIKQNTSINESTQELIDILKDNSIAKLGSETSFKNKEEIHKFIDMIIDTIQSNNRFADIVREIQVLQESFFQVQEENFQDMLEEGKISELRQLSPHTRSEALEKNDLIYLLQSALSQRFFYQDNKVQPVVTETKNLFDKVDPTLGNDDFLPCVWIYPENIPKDFLIKFFDIDENQIRWEQELMYIRLKFAEEFRELFLWAVPLKLLWWKATYKCTFLQHGEHKWKIVDFSKLRIFYRKSKNIPYRRMKAFDDVYEYMEHLKQVQEFSIGQKEEIQNIVDELSDAILKVKVSYDDQTQLIKLVEDLKDNFQNSTNRKLVNASFMRFAKFWLNHSERLKKQFSWTYQDLHNRLWELSRILYHTGQVYNTLQEITKFQEKNLQLLDAELQLLMNQENIDRQEVVAILKNYLDNFPNFHLRPFCSIYDSIYEYVWRDFEKIPDYISQNFANHFFGQIREIIKWNYW